MQLLKLCRDNVLGMRIHWCGCECVDWGWGLHVLVGDMVERIRIYDPPTQQPWSTACSWTLASCSPVFHIRACPPSGIVELTKIRKQVRKKLYFSGSSAATAGPAVLPKPAREGEKPITYNTCFAASGLPLTTLHFYHSNFVPDDEQHGDPPLLSLLPAEPHSDPLHPAVLLLLLLLPAALHPRDQQQHPGFKHHLRSFLFQPALLRVTHLGFAQVVGNPEIQSESQRILSLAAFTGRLAASLGLGSSLAALHPPAQWPLPLPPPEPALSTHLYPLVLQSSKCLFKKLSFS